MRDRVPRIVCGSYVAPALLLCVCLAVLAPAADAGSLAEARELLGADHAAALEAYRELQVENPDLEEAVFGVGCALYKQGEAHLALEAAEEAVAAFEEARTTFEGLLSAKDTQLAVDAAFNRANCVARMAKMLPVPEQHAAAVEAYREAIAAYEAVLRQGRIHERAVRNLDHVRYQLKVLLQNPPEEQEPPEPPPSIAIFGQYTTEILGATVDRPEENMVQLHPEGAQP